MSEIEKKLNGWIAVQPCGERRASGGQRNLLCLYNMREGTERPVMRSQEDLASLHLLQWACWLDFDVRKSWDVNLSWCKKKKKKVETTFSCLRWTLFLIPRWWFLFHWQSALCYSFKSDIMPNLLQSSVLCCCDVLKMRMSRPFVRLFAPYL